MEEAVKTEKQIAVMIFQEGFEGKYVALRSFTDNKPIASDKDPKKVIKIAAGQGVLEPVVFFVPDANSASLYWC
jgi:hypothetical protein